MMEQIVCKNAQTPRARGLLWLLFGVMLSAPALAQSSSATYETRQGFVNGVVTMGLDVNGRAWPCGSASATIGCGVAIPPMASTSTTIAGSVAAANVFQSVMAANPARKGCLIVNKSTAPLMVFLGAPGAASPALSIMLSAGTATSDGGRLNCAVGSGVVISDAVSLSSPTAGSAYLVIWQ